MSLEDRQERGTALCRQLTADVAKVAPEGIGGWAPAWDIVADADVRFLSTLSAWEAAPSEATRLRVKAAYEAVLDAWRVAAGLYQARRQAAK